MAKGGKEEKSPINVIISWLHAWTFVLNSNGSLFGRWEANGNENSKINLKNSFKAFDFIVYTQTRKPFNFN